MKLRNQILLGVLPVVVLSLGAVGFLAWHLSALGVHSRWLLLSALAVSAMLAVVGIMVSVSNALRPIRELISLLEEVEAGRFDVELDTSTGGEIDRLAEAFNHMTDQLREHRDELEDRVESRTEQMRTINEKLRREVEERREAERALRESERRYRALMEQSVEAIYMVDADSLEIIDCNPAFLEWTGYDRDEVEGMHISEIIVGDDAYPDHIFAQIVDEGVLSPREGQWEAKSGERIDVRITGSHIELDDRSIVFVVGRDIREGRRLRAKLEVTDRLASLGTLAAGLAHEINNPLSYIVTNLHFLEKELNAASDRLPSERADEWEEVIEQSLDGANRVQQIVDDLRSFYRSDNSDIQLVDVREVFESVVGLAESDLPQEAGIVREFEDVPPVRANEGALSQVFMNLLVNAIQALPDDRRGREDRIRVRTHMEDPKHVGIEITDTGEGIPEEEIGRIFDPFFTTKPVDEGTGLGLSMSLNIITSFDGEIDVESTVGEGTSFYVTLPIAQMSELSASSVPFDDESDDDE